MINLSKEEYLKKAKDHAISHGGVCLSEEYIRAKNKLKWKCAKGHNWESDYDHTISRNRWCRQCAYDKSIMEDGYEQAMNYAKSKGGLVLVPKNTVIKSHTDLTWKCHDTSHSKWISNFRNTVKLGCWCPYCAGRFSKDEYLEKAKKYAISKGGLCLSDKYENQNTKLRFKCNVESHKEFISEYDRLVPWDRWCKECKPDSQVEKEKRNKYLEKAKKNAESKDGKCLSEEYKNNDSKLLWQCSKNHKWKATYQNVVGVLNRWCPECAGQFPPEEQLEKAKKYAISKGGQCLSTQYIPYKKMIWKCRENHQPWLAKMSSVMNSKNSTWCPECGNSIYYKENNTRVILEFLLGFELKKAKPIWNLNPLTNHSLELDGYNEKNKFAFEFQGRHHFEENVYKKTSLKETQIKDKIKTQNCINNNVFLLIINDKKHMGDLKDHINYVVEILKTKKIEFNKNFDLKLLIEKIEEFNKISPKNEYLKKAQDYANSKNGKCLSNAYINSTTKLEWKCHQSEHLSWFAKSYISTSKSWCPQCKGKKPKMTK